MSFADEKAAKAQAVIDAALASVGAPDGSQAPLETVDYSDYIGSFEPPDYLVDQILQCGKSYTLTARTGHMKTAFASYLALCVATGSPCAGLEVKRGRVLYLSGENDEDQKARIIATASEYGFAPDPGYFQVVAGNGPIGPLSERIERASASKGPFALIVADTSAAYFGGDDDNNNAQMLQHASYFRMLTRASGAPTSLSLCHPIKNADKDNLVPRGGSAFINEVDGNLTLWKSVDRVTLGWHGKFRGPSFDPIDFIAKPVTLDGYKDSRGRPIDSVVIKPLSEGEATRIARAEWADSNKLLFEMLHHPDASIADWATACGFTGTTGKAQKSKVHNLLHDLKADKLAKAIRGGRWVLTPEGREEAKKIT